MLSVADIGFLLALLVIWLERVDVGLFTRDGWCPVLGDHTAGARSQATAGAYRCPVVGDHTASARSQATAGARRCCTRRTSAASWPPGTSSSSPPSDTSSYITRCARTALGALNGTEIEANKTIKRQLGYY